MPTCPKCSKANPKRAKFCYDCGSSMYPPPPVTTMPSVSPTVSVQSTKPSPSVRVISPTGIPTPAPLSSPMAQGRIVSMKIPSMGTCSYHRELPAMYLCSRCSRQICKACGRQYLNMTFCPECYSLSVPQPRYR